MTTGRYPIIIDIFKLVLFYFYYKTSKVKEAAIFSMMVTCTSMYQRESERPQKAFSGAHKIKINLIAEFLSLIVKKLNTFAISCS